MTRYEELKQRLSEPFSEDECVEWWGARDSKGYGIIKVDGKCMRVIRVVVELCTDMPAPHGYMVCHRCDHPPCMNPYHLFLGTNQTNMRDAYLKGRVVPPGVTPRKRAKN